MFDVTAFIKDALSAGFDGPAFTFIPVTKDRQQLVFTLLTASEAAQYTITIDHKALQDGEQKDAEGTPPEHSG